MFFHLKIFNFLVIKRANSCQINNNRHCQVTTILDAKTLRP